MVSEYTTQLLKKKINNWIYKPILDNDTGCIMFKILMNYIGLSNTLYFNYNNNVYSMILSNDNKKYFVKNRSENLKTEYLEIEYSEMENSEIYKKIKEFYILHYQIKKNIQIISENKYFNYYKYLYETCWYNCNFKITINNFTGIILINQSNKNVIVTIEKLHKIIIKNQSIFIKYKKDERKKYDYINNLCNNNKEYIKKIKNSLMKNENYEIEENYQKYDMNYYIKRKEYILELLMHKEQFNNTLTLIKHKYFIDLNLIKNDKYLLDYCSNKEKMDIVLENKKFHIKKYECIHLEDNTTRSNNRFKLKIKIMMDKKMPHKMISNTYSHLFIKRSSTKKYETQTCNKPIPFKYE